MAFTPFPTPTFMFGQTTASTTSCGRILLDPQGHFHYTSFLKKRLLISHYTSFLKKRLLISNYLDTGDIKKQTEGPRLSLGLAIDDAGIDLKQINCVNASANGSTRGDQIEAKAIELFFEGVDHKIPITSIKGAVGECNGSAGALQVISSLCFLSNNGISPTLNCDNPSIDNGRLYVVQNRMEKREINNVLITSFDRFGYNSCLVLKKLVN